MVYLTSAVCRRLCSICLLLHVCCVAIEGSSVAVICLRNNGSCLKFLRLKNTELSVLLGNYIFKSI